VAESWQGRHEKLVVSGRVCAIKKSRMAAQLAGEKIVQAASKKQKAPQPETFESAGYIFVFTTLSSKVISALQILEIYRGRWRIEQAFKRLKSLLELGVLPSKGSPGAKSWIHGKLFAAMLIVSLIRNAEIFFPRATKSPMSGRRNRHRCHRRETAYMVSVLRSVVNPGGRLRKTLDS
jgi:transposase